MKIPEEIKRRRLRRVVGVHFNWITKIKLLRFLDLPIEKRLATISNAINPTKW